MDIDGDSALIVLVNGQTSKYEWASRYEVSYSEGKMFLDPDNDSPRTVYGRSVDELGLECLNCDEIRGNKMPTRWHGVSEDFDLEANLEKQLEEARIEREEKDKAYAESKAKKEKRFKAAQARIEDERTKLGPLEGIWVGLRDSNLSPLNTFHIDPDSGIFFRRHDPNTGSFSDFEMVFEVTDGALVIVERLADSSTYTLNAEGNLLRCSTCGGVAAWLKIDSSKINDVSYINKISYQRI